MKFPQAGRAEGLKFTDVAVVVCAQQIKFACSNPVDTRPRKVRPAGRKSHLLNFIPLFADPGSGISLMRKAVQRCP
jgi:hypothetical protein